MQKPDKKPKIIVVAGPTASGKSALAVSLAERFAGEVVSADSRQVYRGLDIGTAKTTTEEMRAIPHHLIDICDIDAVYTAADFKRDASKAIAAIIERGHLPIIAGGTFFYIDVLLGRAGAAPVPPNWELRASLERKSAAELALMLRAKDLRRYQEIDVQNKRRLIRALEITSSLDYVPLPTSAPVPYDLLTIGLSVEKEILRERYRERALSWLARGFQAEVEELLARGVKRERLSEIGFEYTLMLSLIDGAITEQAFVEKFIEKNWQYAKRQMLWLKRTEGIHWSSPEDQDLPDLVQKFLS